VRPGECALMDKSSAVRERRLSSPVAAESATAADDSRDIHTLSRTAPGRQPVDRGTPPRRTE